jgi:exodeoxyribonuclease V alpha subunit
MPIEFSAEQEEAIELTCSKEPIVAITGPSGTGKTSIMKSTFALLTEDGARVAVAAPTGKAAKRIEQATGIDRSQTCHRLLEFPRPGEIDPKTGKVQPWAKPFPKRTGANPLEYDALLIDEFSMVNWQINDYLFDAMIPGCYLRAFGDIQQLQPIETDPEYRDKNSPFREILNQCPNIKLKNIWRNSGGIVRQGDRILKGQLPENDDNFYLIQTSSNDVLTTLNAWLGHEFCEGIDYLGSLEHQIITPSNKTSIGVAELNLYFQQKIKNKNPKGWYRAPRNPWDKNSGIEFNIGIKVIQSKNDYNLWVMNGEIGIVTNIDPENNMTVDFGDRSVIYPFVSLVKDQYDFEKKVYPQADLDVAHVITTHRAQGSEYENIIYVMNHEAKYTHRRSNYYTATTRARLTATTICDDVSLVNSVIQR